MAKSKSQKIRDQALEIFRIHGGVLKTSEAITAGIHPRILYELRDTGQVEQLMKGVYALPGLPGIDQPDFVTVTKKVPSGVICLLSALYFHELSVQIPRWVDVAVRQSYHPPKIFHPPIHFHWFSDVVFESEVELHDLGGIEVKVYSQEKSIVDSFRLRTKIGLDVALESLKTYWARGRADIGLLRRLAERSRVLKIMSPYIESVIHGQP